MIRKHLALLLAGCLLAQSGLTGEMPAGVNHLSVPGQFEQQALSAVAAFAQAPLAAFTPAALRTEISEWLNEKRTTRSDPGMPLTPFWNTSPGSTVVAAFPSLGGLLGSAGRRRQISNVSPKVLGMLPTSTAYDAYFDAFYAFFIDNLNLDATDAGPCAGWITAHPLSGNTWTLRDLRALLSFAQAAIIAITPAQDEPVGDSVRAHLLALKSLQDGLHQELSLLLPEAEFHTLAISGLSASTSIETNVIWLLMKLHRANNNLKILSASLALTQLIHDAEAAWKDQTIAHSLMRGQQEQLEEALEILSTELQTSDDNFSTDQQNELRFIVGILENRLTWLTMAGDSIARDHPLKTLLTTLDARLRTSGITIQWPEVGDIVIWGDGIMLVHAFEKAVRQILQGSSRFSSSPVVVAEILLSDTNVDLLFTLPNELIDDQAVGPSRWVPARQDHFDLPIKLPNVAPFPMTDAWYVLRHHGGDLRVEKKSNETIYRFSLPIQRRRTQSPNRGLSTAA